MTDFNYKKYSLENLENWLHDAMSAGEATPQEIFDTIKNVVQEQYYYYKDGASRTYELLSLLNGQVYFNTDSTGDDLSDVDGIYMKQSPLFCDADDSSEECRGSWNSFWEDVDNWSKDDKVVKWQLPVGVDELTGDCYVNFPDDLLEAANLKEGDIVQWIDRNDGSFELRKVTEPLGTDEC